MFQQLSPICSIAVAIRELMEDSVRPLVSHFSGVAEAQKRQPLTADTVSQDINGLRLLIQSGCYRAAVNLTSKLLQAYNQGPGQGGENTVPKHTPMSLKIWFVRLSLLVKLRQFSAAESEGEAFGDLDRPDLYYQYYPTTYPGRQGAMPSFAFRILLAELPQYVGKPFEALDRLYALLSIVKKVGYRTAFEFCF